MMNDRLIKEAMFELNKQSSDKFSILSDEELYWTPKKQKLGCNIDDILEKKFATKNQQILYDNNNQLNYYRLFNYINSQPGTRSNPGSVSKDSAEKHIFYL